MISEEKWSQPQQKEKNHIGTQCLRRNNERSCLHAGYRRRGWVKKFAKAPGGAKKGGEGRGFSKVLSTKVGRSACTLTSRTEAIGERDQEKRSSFKLGGRQGRKKSMEREAIVEGAEGAKPLLHLQKSREETIRRKNSKRTIGPDRQTRKFLL